jgi:Zn-dependent peptidase ImmA (M78 family)
VFLEISDLSPDSVPTFGNELRIEEREDPESAARTIRSCLEIDAWPGATWHHPNDLLNQAVAAAEDLAVLVIQTRRVEPSEMQGFSISERPFPVIALNGKDPPRRRVFTLLHELCHIALNVGGICDLHERLSGSASREDEIERYCNQVAAAVLMPKDKVLNDPLVHGRAAHHHWSLQELAELSNRFGASSEAVLIRLIDLGRAPRELYSLRKPALDARYEELQNQQKESEGGPNYYVVKARTLGHGYVNSVLDAYHNRSISSRDVADYLEVRFDQIPQLARRVS